MIGVEYLIFETKRLSKVFFFFFIPCHSLLLERENGYTLGERERRIYGFESGEIRWEREKES